MGALCLGEVETASLGFRRSVSSASSSATRRRSRLSSALSRALVVSPFRIRSFLLA
jgi:hypothetical protein